MLNIQPCLFNCLFNFRFIGCYKMYVSTIKVYRYSKQKFNILNITVELLPFDGRSHEYGHEVSATPVALAI